MYIACEKCKYNPDGECKFYIMGSGNEIDMPCYREKELINGAADNFLQALVGSESMTKEKIIQGLQFTIEMCLFDPMTGAKRPKEVLNDLDKTTVDSCEGAIKLLNQEPYNDCVSREKALEMAKNCYHVAECMEDLENLFEDNLKRLPPVQPKQEWIPVTERLPERSGKYVVLYESRLDNKTHLGMDYYFVSDVRNELNGWIHLNVIKWLPIPEYKENKE